MRGAVLVLVQIALPGARWWNACMCVGPRRPNTTFRV